jgi:putative membrane protein
MANRIGMVAVILTLGAGVAAAEGVAANSATNSPTSATSTRTKEVSAKDKTFLTKAAQGGAMEVQAGKLATAQGNSERVKSFGERMAKDHGSNGETLKALASSKNVALPAGIGGANEATVSELKSVSGRAFDQKYSAMMVKDHEEDIAEFKKAASSADDPEVRSYAQSTLPTLEEHLKMARALPGVGTPSSPPSSSSR